MMTQQDSEKAIFPIDGKRRFMFAIVIPFKETAFEVLDGWNFKAADVHRAEKIWEENSTLKRNSSGIKAIRRLEPSKKHIGEMSLNTLQLYSSDKSKWANPRHDN